MNTLRLLHVLFLLVSLCSLPVQADEARDTLSADGPYILYNADGGARVISVNPKGEVVDTTYASLPQDFSFEVVSHDGKHRFPVSLHQVERPGWKYDQPKKLFVMSDPHGNLDCVISLLQGNGVIDEDYRWSYGKNRLMIIGDVFDRGNDVMQIFWLIYKLEKEAQDAGGQVDFLLGNHEPLVLMNDLRYTKKKYKMLADTLHMEYPQLLSRSTELGYWLCTRNTMQLIGSNLFVHAGLSKQFFDHNLSIPTVNEEMSHGLYKRRAERMAESPLTYFLFATYGPIWYRGMVRQDAKYYPLAADSLQMILKKYDAERVIVGHTIFKDISTFYDKKVIAVNVDNQENRDAKRGRGILIEGKKIFVVGDEGKMRPL
ncbi:MAG: metallophosphoesterase [Bacteroides sp.]|nr:metallophosphoesterase [Bacteroides sp.]